MQKSIPLMVALLLLNGSVFAPMARGAGVPGVRSSVFKIHVSATQPSFTDPWKRQVSGGGTGTGFYIGDGRILTNAHVVANASFLTILRDGDARPVQGHVKFIAHDCDLAIVEPEDPAFLKNITPMEFGTLPRLRSPVATIGFPMGGEQISITEGIVSRISYRRYVHHGGVDHLLVQVDSAINPGNSGGPVVQGRKVVGVAFQAYLQAQNTGYMIPTPVIARFLKDIEDGQYDGHPLDGLETMEWSMVNTSTAQFHSLEPSDGGIKISHVAPWAPSFGQLAVDDVLLAVDGRDIGVDGKIEFHEERVDFRVIYDLKQINESVKFKVMRKGKVQNISVKITKDKAHPFTGNVYARYPKYFVYGGLVFTTLTRSFLQVWGDKWYTEGPLMLRYLAGHWAFAEETQKDRDIVVLAKKLPDQVNAYINSNFNGIVSSVDGFEVFSFEDLVDFLEKGKDEFAVIKFVGSEEPLVISRMAVKARGELINRKYGVAPDRWLNGPEVDGAVGDVMGGKK